MDNGLLYATEQAGVADTGKQPGLWELPQNYLRWPETRTGNIGYCDKDWFWAFRKGDPQTRGAKTASVLKYNLDLRLAGNRAPFHLCLHSQEWADPSWVKNAPTENMLAKQAALQEFLTYALSKPEVRVVRQIDVIRWMREPVPLQPTP